MSDPNDPRPNKADDTHVVSRPTRDVSRPITEQDGVASPTEVSFSQDGLVTRLGRYEILKPLDEGGMAEVFLARHQGPAGFEKKVVIKRIRPELSDDERFVRMFLREARNSARLSHPNVVSVFELAEDDDQYFIVMEYLDGMSWRNVAARRWYARRPLPIPALLKAIGEAAYGLAHAHDLRGPQGEPTPLVHRDISPDNVFVTRSGVTKVLDFGVAKADAENELRGLTQTGEIKGKVPYMSPEQLMGEHLDGRSDVWSLGVTLYWLLTGVRPFKGRGQIQLIDQILKSDAPDPRHDNANISSKVAAMVQKALQRDLHRRYATATEFGDALLDACADRDVLHSTQALVVDAITLDAPPSFREVRVALKSAPASEMVDETVMRPAASASITAEAPQERAEMRTEQLIAPDLTASQAPDSVLDGDDAVAPQPPPPDDAGVPGLLPTETVAGDPIVAAPPRFRADTAIVENPYAPATLPTAPTPAGAIVVDDGDANADRAAGDHVSADSDTAAPPPSPVSSAPAEHSGEQARGGEADADPSAARAAAVAAPPSVPQSVDVPAADDSPAQAPLEASSPKPARKPAPRLDDAALNAVRPFGAALTSLRDEADESEDAVTLALSVSDVHQALADVNAAFTPQPTERVVRPATQEFDAPAPRARRFFGASVLGVGLLAVGVVVVVGPRYFSAQRGERVVVGVVADGGPATEVLAGQKVSVADAGATSVRPPPAPVAPPAPVVVAPPPEPDVVMVEPEPPPGPVTFRQVRVAPLKGILWGAKGEVFVVKGGRVRVASNIKTLTAYRTSSGSYHDVPVKGGVANLNRLPTRRVRFVSDHKGATVRYRKSNRVLGTLPFSPRALTVGRYAFVITFRDGSTTETGQVEVAPGNDVLVITALSSP